MDGTTLGGDTHADSKKDSRPDLRADSTEKRKPRPTGDVDSNGDLIYEALVGRVCAAVDRDQSPHEAHVAGVVRMITAGRELYAPEPR